MIDQILNNVRGNMEVLSVNEEELHNAFDAHLCAEDWDSSEVTTALDHEMPLRLGMIRQIRQLLKDTSNETSSSLKEIRQQWSHFEKLDKSTEELLMTKYQIQKAIIQLQMFADESHNPSDLARYSALDYRSTQLQKSIRTKLQTVNNLKDQLISQMMPLKARVQGTELSVEKVKELLFQLNALISDKTTVVDELAAKLAKTKLQQPKEPRALSLTAAKAPSARWHVGQQINLRPKFISLQKLE
ncbi:hypothetical protein CANTEDRAFT_116805 [Yamadazyma tenuis ATCC 10573]|uniref:Uncharacterized protein n=2 Tax=Candida tenuis TaxID=2315449 RepID=G3BFU6_CANTC|nr:uncharacterized protein CANTEDRAFT_116805 [Yamadazyma tenuis ATCC 10573]EGV60732.1 hypothetical protein CANTEDRAFT_116805 [Yamadazyma tenuis ATCC 10573]